MSARLDVRGLDRAAVLAALYNGSRPLGMGIFHFNPEPMTPAEASEILESVRQSGLAIQKKYGGAAPEGIYFDYLKGRVMKIDLAEDLLRVDLYDRDNGPGAARRALEVAGLVVVEVVEEVAP